MSKQACMAKRQFLRDSRGTTTVEFSIIMLVFFTFVFGIVDFCRAFWEMNSAAKSAQAGARFAVVSDPVALGLTFDCDAAGFDKGDSVPVGSFNGGNPILCDRSGGGANCTVGGADDAAFMAIVTEMQKFYDKIQPDNVVVRYEHVGLGFCGNPFGSSIDPLVTVRVQGVTFTFVTPGLASLAATATVRTFESSQVAEDMES